MIRRRESIALFGMSFLDVLFCALGGVVMLLMQTIHSTQELAKSDVQIAALNSELEGLNDELDTARSRIAGLGTELQGARGEAEDARADTEQARGEARQASADAQQARNELAELRQDSERNMTAVSAKLDDERKQRAAAEMELRERIGDLEESLSDARSANEQASKEVAAAEGSVRDRIADLEGDLSAARTENTRLRGNMRGVLGLRGPMKNVVFLFDTSQSLGRAVRGGERFVEYKELLKAWVSNLQFDQFNLVRFHTSVETVRGWENKLVEASADNRDAACGYVDSFQPAGTTNTMGAIQYALDRLENVDTVVLFSDGEPNAEDGKPGGGEQAVQWILGYLKQNNRQADGRPTVMINTVAMGDYLNATYGEFLRDLAEQNGGVFIGR